MRTFARQSLRRLGLALFGATLIGCAGTASSDYSQAPSYGGYDDVEAIAYESDAPSIASDSAARRAPSRPQARPQAQGGASPTPPPLAAGSAQTTGGASTSPSAEEQARPTRLLVYTASLHMAIFEVNPTQEAALKIVEDLGGYASRRTTNQLTLRVPAEYFRQALDALSKLGDVTHTQWQAHDVSESFRDLNIRLQNALEVHARMSAILERAQSVEDTLKVEAQLARLTQEIEQLRSQIENLSQQIAFSTIDVHFQQRHHTQLPADDYLLPFPWLNELGLESLLRAPEATR
ncbi:DUF4349 domain-containing protein [Lujinxingia vulgaris]|uniref:DUF4349 domain-containing protein n=1 Tax=Lujinxingia vulgaris TaxID=2600176 RepID=A0A5C6XEN4_9DELT|nr:DUF4349 domain-containing protein [Lujinxingia vulgaris]TXD36574.1 DUF4349 domain-containing protein [Lujinxingia vulgaris]